MGWLKELIDSQNLLLKKSDRGTNTWSSKLNVIQYVVINTYHSSIKVSLSKYECRGHADSPLIKFLNNFVKIDLDVEFIREQSKQIAVEATNKLKDYNKIYYDKHHKISTKYVTGDFVLI